MTLSRKLWNGMWDKHPALIARCASVEDVRNSVTFAARRNLLVCGQGRRAQLARQVGL